jgi:hypothetical protein
MVSTTRVAPQRASLAGTTPAIVGWPGAQYDVIVASGFATAATAAQGGPRVGLMMVVMLLAGIGCLLAGLVAIGFGIPVKEFSFGNTLILAGAIAACTGLVMLGLWSVVRELRGIAERLGPTLPADDLGSALLPTVVPIPQGSQPAEMGASRFTRDELSEQPGKAEADLHPDAGESLQLTEAFEARPAPKPRRNLMFSSSSRRERERAQTRTTEHSTTAPDPGANEPAAGTFTDTWSKPERTRSTEAAVTRRGGRAPSTFSDPPADNVDQPPVTVLKSGVVDGMAYSLYSDGSIEAQMPEGMMRFASIDELRAHLDQRP